MKIFELMFQLLYIENQESNQKDTSGIYHENLEQQGEKLVMQVDFTKLLIEEKENVTCRSITNNVPREVLSLALNSATNTLPTPDNLRKWGKRMMSKCPCVPTPAHWNTS